VITLRPYQSSGIAQIREAFAMGFKAPLYVCPTGSGKTTVFAAIAESSEKRGKRVLILCHRVELVDQIVERLKQFNVTPEIIAAGYTRSAGRVRVSNRPVAVASVQTLIRRLDSYAAPTLTIADEAHHCAGGNTWSQILRRYPGTKILGTTASPIRGDGRGLAAHFDKLIMGPYPHELTEMCYLAKARVFSPPTVDTSGLHIRYGEYKTDESEALMDTPAITGDAFTHYRKHADGKSAIVFCTSVKHAHNVAEKFRKEDVSAIALDGGTDKELRRMAMKDFREDKIKVVTNCALFSEGLDIEGVHCGTECSDCRSSNANGPSPSMRRSARKSRRRAFVCVRSALPLLLRALPCASSAARPLKSSRARMSRNARASWWS
jgi:DNA repair protein RadD